MLYIKQTDFGFAVMRYNEVIREFVSYDEALDYITRDIESRKEKRNYGIIS